MGKGWDRDVDINQCVFIFLFIQQLFLTFQHEIKNSINQSINLFLFLFLFLSLFLFLFLFLSNQSNFTSNPLMIFPIK